MSDRRALDALLHALVDRDGAARTRDLLCDAATLALRPPSTESNPETWHSADVALGFAGHMLAQELLDTMARRDADVRCEAAMAKAAKKTRPT